MSSASNTLSNTYSLIGLNQCGCTFWKWNPDKVVGHTLISPNKRVSVWKSIKKRVLLTFLFCAFPFGISWEIVFSWTRLLVEVVIMQQFCFWRVVLIWVFGSWNWQCGFLWFSWDCCLINLSDQFCVRSRGRWSCCYCCAP